MVAPRSCSLPIGVKYPALPMRTLQNPSREPDHVSFNVENLRRAAYRAVPFPPGRERCLCGRLWWPESEKLLECESGKMVPRWFEILARWCARRGSLCQTHPEAHSLFIEVGGVAVTGVGAEGAIGYAIPLVKKPDGRYYPTGGVGGGIGAVVGADVSVGLSSESMPTEHWATDKGKSVNFSGKATGAVSLSIDFPRDTAKRSGFTVSGGIGVVIATWDKNLYNF